MTGVQTCALPISCIGEGNGNPLQCSCLENPRDGGAWWAVIYGVAQSQTWLKWLSSIQNSQIWKNSVRNFVKVLRFRKYGRMDIVAHKPSLMIIEEWIFLCVQSENTWVFTEILTVCYLLSHVQLFETPWTAAHQAPPSMGFSRQEYWSGVPSPSPQNSCTVL